MNGELLLEALKLLAMLALGFAAIYFKAGERVGTKTAALIAQAEETYRETAKSGGQKFEWVVDQLYAMLPAPLRLVITRSIIGEMVQTTFDELSKYAALQIERVVNETTGA